MNVALQFPGQGSQTPGFFSALPAHPAVNEVLREAEEQLGRGVASLDSAPVLETAVGVQLSLLIAGVAFARFLQSEGVPVGAAAGMSVGAFAAAVAAGGLPFASALRFVERRAALMASVFPSGYGMAALSGLTERAVTSLLAGTGVRVANLNARTQLVVAGPRDALDALLPVALAAGASSANVLRMSTASHIPELGPAAQELLAYAKTLPMNDAAFPVFSNRTARPLRRAEDIRNDLALNMAHPVRWLDVQTALLEHAPSLLLEAPSGHTLTHLVRELDPDCKALAAADMRWDVLLREARKSAG